MRILLVGDIVGSPGRQAFARIVGLMRQRGEVDFVVANAENAAGGRGLTPPLARELLEMGADVITLGDHVWDQKDLAPFLEQEPRVLRPANLPSGCPGRGWVTLEKGGHRVTVINLVGRVFMPPHYDCPFRTADAFLKSTGDLGRIVLVDMHAEATSEKIALGRYLDGRVTAVVGTHTHVQTADEIILPGGTAYLTDLGMTGPHDSVLGRELAPVLRRFLTGMPAPFDIASGRVRLEGLLVLADPETGRAKKVRRLQEPLDSHELA